MRKLQRGIHMPRIALLGTLLVLVASFSSIVAAQVDIGAPERPPIPNTEGQAALIQPFPQSGCARDGATLWCAVDGASAEKTHTFVGQEGDRISVLGRGPSDQWVEIILSEGTWSCGGNGGADSGFACSLSHDGTYQITAYLAANGV
jgi:hypothetical protein